MHAERGEADSRPAWKDNREITGQNARGLAEVQFEDKEKEGQKKTQRPRDRLSCTKQFLIN